MWGGEGSMNIFICEDGGYFLRPPKITEVLKNTEKKLKTKNKTVGVCFMWNVDETMQIC